MNTEVLIDDGITLVYIVRQFLNKEYADDLCKQLRSTIPWENHEVMIYGKKIDQPRRTYACGDPSVKSHRYSGQSTPVYPWLYDNKIPTPLDECHSHVSVIANEVTTLTHVPLNTCLLNEYSDGSKYIGYHSDKEVTSLLNSVFTVSLGGPRDFFLMRKNKDLGINSKVGNKVTVSLQSGDLCVMQKDCQREWTHSIPKRAHANYRISLTYRWLE